MTLEDRVAKASKNASDLFISIHANSAVPEASGTETYYNSTYQAADSERLASDIQERLPDALGTRDRGVKESGFMSSKFSNAECFSRTGLYHKQTDADKLESPEYQEKLQTRLLTLSYLIMNNRRAPVYDRVLVLCLC
ncbi:N-acetylmuramoyl-L-alanine amidase [Bacillus licheniformis]|nr:N-acetylmuramoyl-L-alanine amidase [Bacillus licheniformis]